MNPSGAGNIPPEVPAAKNLRLFVALPVPAQVKGALQEMQTRLETVLPRGSTAWTKPDNMHLTLRFLGEVAVERVPELRRRLREALTGCRALDLICERLGCFPEPRYPRVIWAWVHDQPHECLLRLQQTIDSAVAEIVVAPAEARFVGHVTLARPKQIKRSDAEKLGQFLEAASTTRFGVWHADAVELIRSELSPQGSRYTTLDVFPL